MWVATVVEVVVVEIANVSTEIVVFVHAIVGIVVISIGVDLDTIFRC